MKNKKDNLPEKKTAGRLLFDGRDEKDILTKLEHAWSMGGSDAEAAAYAGITPMSLSRYLKANPDISLRKEALKNEMFLKIKTEIIQGVTGDKDFAFKVAERLIKDYTQKQKIDSKVVLIDVHAIAMQLINEMKEPRKVEDGG